MGTVGLFTTTMIKVDNSYTSPGLNNSSLILFFTVSLTPPAFAAITDNPAAIASNTTLPKVSVEEGKMFCIP